MKENVGNSHPGKLKFYQFKETEAKFKEFKPRLKYGWFHLKYSIFQDLSWRIIETGFGEFDTRLKFIKFKLKNSTLDSQRYHLVNIGKIAIYFFFNLEMY